MADLNENLEKVKSTVENVAQKVKDSEAAEKVREAAAGVSEKLGENEHVEKIKKSKYGKYIKIAAIVVVIVLAFNLIGSIFGDGKTKKAQKYIVSEYTTEYKEDSYKNVKVKAKAVGKNKSSHLYCFDVTVTGKYYNDKVKDTSFVIVYSDGTETYIARDYEYSSSNKKDVKEIALAALSRG